MTKPTPVIRAISELTGKTEEEINKFLEHYVAEQKEKGNKMSKTVLLKQFKRPGSPTALVMERFESEKKPKSKKLDNLDLF